MFLISRMEVRSPVCRLHNPSPLLNLYLSSINKGENQEVAQILVLIGNFLHEHDILKEVVSLKLRHIHLNFIFFGNDTYYDYIVDRQNC